MACAGRPSLSDEWLKSTPCRHSEAQEADVRDCPTRGLGRRPEVTARDSLRRTPAEINSRNFATWWSAKPDDGYVTLHKCN